VSSGPLRLDVLWPPRERLWIGPPALPNELCLVLLARWHGFRMLLTGDAEAELAPVDPGDVDVLKVAHHGSDDAGLEALLGRTDPELAVISVGADNTFGHPTATTLATLTAAGVPVLRTDLDGSVEIAAAAGSWHVMDP
jgi:competence protein ComEC